MCAMNVPKLLQKFYHDPNDAWEGPDILEDGGSKVTLWHPEALFFISVEQNLSSQIKT